MGSYGRNPVAPTRVGEGPVSTDCVEELGGRGGPADIGVTSDCAASLGGGDCLLSGYELGQLAEVLGDCSEVEFVAGTARPAQP